MEDVDLFYSGTAHMDSTREALHDFNFKIIFIYLIHGLCQLIHCLMWVELLFTLSELSYGYLITMTRLPLYGKYICCIVRLISREAVYYSYCIVLNCPWMPRTKISLGRCPVTQTTHTIYIIIPT